MQRITARAGGKAMYYPTEGCDLTYLRGSADLAQRVWYSFLALGGGGGGAPNVESYGPMSPICFTHTGLIMLVSGWRCRVSVKLPLFRPQLQRQPSLRLLHPSALVSF